MQKKLVKLFGQSWRTGLMGYAGAIFATLLPVIQTGKFNLKTDWPYLVGAAGSAIFGQVAKDAKVSGTPEQKISEETQIANEALAAAKSTGNAKLIEAAQAIVDGLPQIA